MRWFTISVLIRLFFFSSSLCELSLEKQDSFLNDFVDYLNSRPGQPHVYDDGLFLKSTQLDPSTYKIDIRVKVFKPQYPSSYHFEKCTATIIDLGENGITIPNNEYQCIEWVGDETTPVPEGATTDAGLEVEEPLVKQPIHLDNEVQPNNAPTSGEQFIAIPRDRSGPCIGCSSHVDPSAAGVGELAALGARHLNRHEPNVRHTVIAVHDVERQVQVTNGIRYVLTLTVGYNNCRELSTDNCVSDKICKISVISKPWVKLPDGSKYKAILANNCTEQWLFGDDGEPVPETLDENKPTPDNDKVANSGSADEIIKVVHTEDIQAQQHTQVPLSNEQIKNIQEQIIPYSEFDESRYPRREIVSTDSILSKKKIENIESAKNPDEDTIQVRKSEKLENTQYITEDKKKAIDDMLNLFNFAEFQPLHEDTIQDLSRGKRSYSSDLKVMSVLEKFQKIKRKLKNAKHIYKLGNLLVDYLNEMDMEVKTRILKDVLFAEEEIEKDQHFFYIRARVIIPCDKVECDNKDTQVKICNGVIDSTDSKSPEVVDTFCYDEEKKFSFGNVKDVPNNDPILLKLTNETIKKIENDMYIRNALRVVKIINANTQKVSGTLTKISMVLEFINCNKTVPFYKRTNCSTVQNLGTKICEAEIHERHWIKEKQITYTCTDRPMDETIEENVHASRNKDPKDSQVMDIVNEALQLLEVQSNRKNKQKIVEIKKVSTQIVVGQLTNVDFVVGYTKCFINDLDIDVNNCDLIDGERLRKCQAQVWERPWLQEGRQLKVVCDDKNKTEINEIETLRKKRHVIGGAIEVDPNDPEYMKLAQESLSKYLEDSGDTKPHNVVKINKVTVQVVAGTLTTLYFEVQSAGEVFSCHSEVWERPWLNSKEISVTCGKGQNSRRKRQLVGGPKEVDANDPKYIQLAQDSLSKYLKDSGNTKPHTVVKVNKVTVQIVSGKLTKIYFDVQGAGEVFSCQSEVWERPWLNSKEITVTCGKDQNSRQKRQVPGAPREVDANDPQYMQLSQESLSKYLKDSGDTTPHTVVKVDKVTVQVVAGTLTKIYFKVQGAGEIFSCQSGVWERPWLNSKEITVTCGKDQNSRQKLQIAGAPREVDANDPQYMQLAQESLSKYLKDSGDTKPHTVVKVNKVTVQVVAGSLTRIYFDVQGAGEIFSCQSEVWERPWLNSKEITVTCGKDQNSRQKRQIAGAPREVDANDPQYMQLAQESLSKYLKDSGDTKPHTVVKVNKVTVQVVAGSLTRIYFDVQGAGEIFSCQSEVWERPWLNSKEITVTCGKDQNSRQKRQIAGAPREVDANDPQYMQLAQESLSKYLKDSGDTKLHTVVKVNKVTVQIVAGTLTRIYFDVQGAGEIFSCQSEVWERPWLNSKEITVTCGKDQNSRRKRQIVGGPKEVDANDPKYIQLAQDSLSKYLKDSGDTKPHTVVKINKVTVQVVAGTLTKIYFDVQGAGEVFSCQSGVWERPWLNSKEITVTCGKDQNSRQKRQVPGAPREADANDPLYMQLAQESLSKYLKDSGDTTPHTVVKVDKVTVQVVAGTLTKIYFKVQGVGEIFSCQSGVWERPWLNSKEITVTCGKDQNSRQKRRISGAPREVDANDPEYMQLAQESLSKYLKDSGDTKPHTVVKVNKVTVQVVAGTLTRIYFNVQGAGEIFSCQSEVWERPWLNSKEITVTCGKDQNSRRKRQIVGGPKDVDANDPKYIQLAQDSLSKYLKDSGDTKPHTVVKVNKVTVQVVAGTLTKIYFDVQGAGEVFSCQSKVWERSWLNSTEITVTCGKDQNSKQKRLKREIIVGGAVEEDPKNENFIRLAEESLNEYVENVGSTKVHKLIELIRVTKLHVSGTLIRLDFVMSPTNCDINDKSHKVCSALENTNIRCHADIWERPWLKGDKKIIDVTCDDLKKINEDADNLQGGYASTRVKSHTQSWHKSQYGKKNSRKSGGPVEQDPAKPLYRVLADEALRKYQLRKKSLDHHEITHVNRVFTQVVSGTKYTIEFEVLRISCAFNEINKTECDQKNNVTLTCHAVIWSRPWLKSKEVNVDCSSGEDVNEDSEEDSSSEETKRKTRAIRGFGLSENKDPNDNTYINLAKEAVKKYQKKMNADHIFKINKILRVTEHVASGFVTNIDFSISPTICLLSNPSAHVDDCQLQTPQVVLYCSAEINEPSIPRTMKIKVGCKKRNKKKNKEQNEVPLNREKRNIPYDDDYVEEDIKYYYADRAITDFNKRASTNNLYKVVSIHDVHRSVHMDTLMVRLYLEIAMTYCMRYGEEHDLQNCDEIDGMNHKLCLARVYPSPDDELVVQHATMTCDDDKNFETISGISVDEFIRVSIAEIEKSPDIHYKLVPLGEPNVIPSLNYKMPIRMNFVVHHTNCSKEIDLNKTPTKCVINLQRSGRNCHSLIYLMPNSRNIQNVVVKCSIGKLTRAKRSVSLNPKNATADDLLVQQMVQESIEKLEMASEHKYKQRVLVINGYSSKIVSGRLTTIDFDVGYTTCLKYEWVENATSCEFLEHLPRRHCISHVWERLWVENGRQIIVNCEDDETPLEAHIEFESAENAMQLANEALKHIEAKYPNPRRQKIVRIFSLEQQAIAGLHYRMKVEVGVTDCMALSINKDDCKLVNDMNSQNKFCRVNVWMRPWTDHPPSFRVTCDYQSGAMDEIYHHVQAERLFYDFLTTYKPDYLNDVTEMKKRFAIFKENVRKIHELNIYDRGTARYAVTRFADLSYEEFSLKYLGLKPGLQNHNQVPMRMAEIPDVELPAKYDWRDYGAVTEVKDQGSCGSCWAFSVTGNIEGQWKLQSGKLVSLSEQELVDCDDLDNGCNGGLPDNAYRAIEKLGGLETENDYPYEGTGDKCAFNRTLSRVHISGAVNITSNETDMAKWLTRNGPISIGINANAMQFYVGGISHPWKMLCNPNNLDHGVLIVGYGAKDYPLFHKHLPYWIIKNSWGERWGEQGYYRVYRGDGTCGVNQMASSAVI